MEECFPEKFLYDKGYSWVKIEGDVAEVGIARPLASAAKEFIFIELPKKGYIKKNDVYVSLESVKWTGHLESPVEGEIIEVNNKLFDEPSLINKEPYKNWIMKVKLSKKPDDLLNAEQKSKEAKCEVKQNF